MRDELQRILGGVAATGLPGSKSIAPQRPFDDRRWSATLLGVRGQRLSGLLCAAIAAGEWPVTDAQYQEIADLHVSQSAWVLHLEQHLLTMAESFDSVGIPFRVLKGSALAHLDYDEPSLRCFGDVDVVVPADLWREAAGVLVASGGRRKFAEPRPGFDTRFSKGACFVTPGAVEVDLHRTLVLGFFGLTIRTEDFFRGAQYFTIAGRELPALDAPARLLHACIHASLGTPEPRMLPLRDVAQLVLKTDDVDEMLTLARSWRCEVVVADAVRTCWDLLGITVDHDVVRWSEKFRPTPRAERKLASYRGVHRSHARLAVDAWSGVDGWSDRLRYLRAIVAPQRAENRVPTALRLRHGLQALRQWRSS